MSVIVSLLYLTFYFTDTPPYSHRRKLPTMPEVTGDQEVIMLISEKDTSTLK